VTASIYNPSRGGFVAVHGHSNAVGGKRTPTYISWQNMRARCRYPSVPSYPHYGGRGITVCERWESFAAFLEDMGERPPGTQLGRIDGNYEPGNVAWVSQVDNLRESNTRNLAKQSPLADEDRAWIRARYGLVPQKVMADALGVSAAAVSRACRRQVPSGS
jgi:hypothetical protein